MTEKRWLRLRGAHLCVISLALGKTDTDMTVIGAVKQFGDDVDGEKLDRRMTKLYETLDERFDEFEKHENHEYFLLFTREELVLTEYLMRYVRDTKYTTSYKQLDREWREHWLAAEVQLQVYIDRWEEKSFFTPTHIVNNRRMSYA